MDVDNLLKLCDNSRNLSKIQTILENDISLLNIGDTDGVTCLHRAAMHGFDEIVLFLLEKGARVDIQTYE